MPLPGNVVRICTRCGDLLPFQAETRKQYYVVFSSHTRADIQPGQMYPREDPAEVCQKCYGEIRKSFQGERLFRARMEPG